MLREDQVILLFISTENTQNWVENCIETSESVCLLLERTWYTCLVDKKNM